MRTVDGKEESVVRVEVGVGGGVAETEAVVLAEAVLLAVGGGVMEGELVMDGGAPADTEEDGVPVDEEDPEPELDPVKEAVPVAEEEGVPVGDWVPEALGVGGKSATFLT